MRAVQPKQEFPVPEAPRLENVDMQGLCEKCPLLKSCYIESLRLDTASWSLKVVNQDFELKPKGDKEAQALLLKKGEYVHVAHDLHNTDPSVFENPNVWKADRHVKYDADGKMLSADLGTIRPYGTSFDAFAPSLITDIPSRRRTQYVQRATICGQRVDAICCCHRGDVGYRCNRWWGMEDPRPQEGHWRVQHK